VRGISTSALLALAACTTTTVAHIPASSRPGTMGFGLASVTQSSFGQTNNAEFTGTAAASPPVARLEPRDVVWQIRVSDKKQSIPRAPGSI
jgi:hypothetical protein